MIRSAIIAAALLLGPPAVHGSAAQTQPEASSCPLVAAPIHFCGTAPDFVLTPQDTNPLITALYESPEGLRALVLVEPIATREGHTVPALQAAAMQLAADVANQPVEMLPVYSRGTVDVAGAAQPNIAYAAFIGGTSVVYSNTIVLRDDSISQFMTVDFGATRYTPRHEEFHTRFLSNVQVDQ